MMKESSFTKEKINDLADKLLIGLSPKENALVLDEFEFIKKQMDIIDSIPDINKVEPMTHPFPVEVSLREDIPSESETITDILSNCDSYDEREIEVPKVVGNEN